MFFTSRKYTQYQAHKRVKLTSTPDLKSVTFSQFTTKSMNKISHECVDCTDFIIMLAGSLCTHLLRFEFYCQSMTQTKHIHWTCVLIIVTLLINFTKLTCLETWEKTLFCLEMCLIKCQREICIVCGHSLNIHIHPWLYRRTLCITHFRLRKWYFLNGGYCLKINRYTVVV